MEVFVQQLINGLTLGSIYGLIAIGYTMVFGIIGMVNFAHGDVFMVSTFIALIVFLALTTLFSIPSIYLALFLVMLSTLGLQGDAPPSTTRLPELIQVLRTNLTLDSAEFEAQASQALIERFGVMSVPGGSTEYRIGELVPVHGPRSLDDWVDQVLGLGVDMLECRRPSSLSGVPAGVIGSRWLSVDGVWPTHVAFLVEVDG
jgi:hypothetical protein